MEWTARAIVLGTRRHGETSLIADLLSGAEGRYKGLVRGGASRRLRGVLEPGNLVSATWRARLPEHLGTVTAELLQANAASVMADKVALAALAAACTLVARCLPERQPHSRLYEGLLALFDILCRLPGEALVWGPAYVRWEAGFLAELGFGLDLSCCAVTGAMEGLAFVSPRSGRAVSADGAGDYRDRLLPLPAFLLDSGAEASPAALCHGLNLTGFFITERLLRPFDKALPQARERLCRYLETAVN